jgi:hypothetical protein
MEVVASVVGGVVVATGWVIWGSIYSMIKDTVKFVKFQSNLDTMEKEMKGLLAVKDKVKMKQN